MKTNFHEQKFILLCYYPELYLIQKCALASTDILIIVPSIMAVTFEKLVQEEFGKSFNIKWTHAKKRCVIDHKENPDDLTACCCPGCVQQYRYTLALEVVPGGAPKVNWRDEIAGTFNRVQGNMAASSGNTSQINSVARMNNTIVQKVSRIESRLLIEHNNATAAATAPVEAETMEERGSIADEIAKLNKLRDDGVLNDEEFEKAKAKALSQ